jgi:hypothetical protein
VAVAVLKVADVDRKVCTSSGVPAGNTPALRLFS